MAIHLNHLSLVEMYTSLHIPEDLLNEPSSIVPATVSLSEESVARSQAMRTSARMALIQLQDSRAMRVALLARPRRAVDFTPRDAVAYWRDQKWVHGKLQLGDRWYTVLQLSWVMLGVI